MTPPPQAYSTAELELAGRARTGDRQAMARLYEQYAPRLYLHAVRMLGDEAAARDAVQEAFTKALDAIGATREELRFRAWIYRIVTNHCLRQLTTRQRWSDQEVPEPDEGGDDPEGALRRAESGVQVLAALDDLPPAYRQILVLRELDELSYEDLARVLESDVSRVRVTLHRARARLAALFVARRLLEDPPSSVECQELGELLDRGAEEKPLVKHLEGCPRCRQRRHRPAVELLALLPTVEVPDLSPLDPPPAPGGGTAALTLKALIPVVLGGAALVLGTVVVVGSHTSELQQKPPKVAVAGRQVSRAMRPAGAPAEETERVESKEGQGQGHGKTERSRPTTAPPGKQPKKRKPTARPGKALAIKLQFTPGTLRVRRGLTTLVPAGPGDLRLGDVLLGGAGASFGLWLPRQQWLIVGGDVRLDAAPRKKARPGKIRVTLLRGQARARATRLGGGILVAVGAVTCQAPEGRFRVRRRGAKVRVESLDAYVSVTGPHAPRTVPPATGLELGRRPGFAHRLPPAPTGLRPVQACAARPPRLSWSPTRGALGYRLQVGTDTDFLDLRRDRTFTRTAATLDTLPPGKYYWRVLARDGTRQGLPSKIYAFTVSTTCP